ncbi:unnamed protein product [Ectocarpus fasciculatus]
MESEMFMGPLGKGSWHGWEQQHLVALLGMVWYNLSRSESSNTNWAQFVSMVESRTGVRWRRKFIRPAETRWMVVWEGAAVLDERWPEVKRLFTEWAPRRLLSTPFLSYWHKSMVMLKNTRIQLHAKFAVELGEKVLFWAYHWLRGKGGFYLKREGREPERLAPAMRFVEVADFILEFERRLVVLRSDPKTYFPELMEWAESNVHEDLLSLLEQFTMNFEESCSSGFFGETLERWQKWTERHQRLPLSMARLPCYNFFVGKWAGSEEKAWELPVGQEFTRALLLALWPGRYEMEEWAGWEEPHQFREILENDLAEASTTRQKD